MNVEIAGMMNEKLERKNENDRPAVRRCREGKYCCAEDSVADMRRRRVRFIHFRH
jgi:hypothetical protein